MSGGGATGLAEAEAACAAGRHAEAAEAFRRLGDRERAAQCIEHTGDLEAAHGHWLAARRWRDAARVRQRAIAHAAPDEAGALRRRLGEACARAGRHGDAAALLELAGDLEAAVEAHEKAGDLTAAARLLRFLGRSGEAIRLLTGHLAGVEGTQQAADVRLELARAQAARGAAFEAATLAQQVLSEGGEARQRAALGVLLDAMDRLGYVGAVDEVWRRLEPLVGDAGAGPQRHLDRARAEHEDTGEGDGRRWVAGRYRLERLIGAGGASQVYLARDEAQDRRVAVKLLSGVGAMGEARAPVDRFFREVRVVRALEHPGIIDILDADPERGWLVMPWLTGGTLAERLRGARRLSVAFTRSVGLQVADALAAAHRRGVLHRDVKPENLLFDAADRLRLTDFGAAHLIGFRQTGTGYLLGTLAYMSPEQLEGDAVDVTTDIWGLAVTLFRCLTGRLPFPGPDVRGQQATAPDLAAWARDVPEAVRAWFARALAEDPAARFTELAEAEAALGTWPDDGGPLTLDEQSGSGHRQEPADGPTDEGIVGAMGERVSLVWDAARLRHVVLERGPEVEDPRWLEAVRAVARAANPHLQRVLDLDVEAGEARWSFVEGEPLPVAARAGALARRAHVIAADIAEAMADHPGLPRPGRILVADGRAVVVVAGADSLTAPSHGAKDLHGIVARVLVWCQTGEDPGSVGGEALGRDAPAEALTLSRWLRRGGTGGPLGTTPHDARPQSR